MEGAKVDILCRAILADLLINHKIYHYVSFTTNRHPI